MKSAKQPTWRYVLPPFVGLALACSVDEHRDETAAGVVTRAQTAALWSEQQDRFDAMGVTFTEAERRAQRARALSFVVRGMPPSVAEAKAAFDGTVTTKSLAETWSTGPQFEAHFADLLARLMPFGFVSDPGSAKLAGGHRLHLPTGSAGLSLSASVGCDAAQATTLSDAEAWFLDPGESVTVCNSALAAHQPGTLAMLTPFLYQHASTSYTPGAFGRAPYPHHVDCGPFLLSCYDKRLPGGLAGAPYPNSSYEGAEWYAIAREPLQRLRHFGLQGASFKDTFFGRKAYVDRFLAWNFLVTEGALLEGRLSAADALAFLKEIPRGSFVETDWPAEVVQAAGVLTSPGFAYYFNNSMRAKGNAVVQFFLGVPLSGLPFDVADVVNKHPKIEEGWSNPARMQPCAVACHLGMDNLATAFSRYGYASQFRDTLQTGVGSSWMQTADMSAARLYGETGDGPAFIADVLTRQPQFYTFMAEQIYRHATGKAWDGLTDATKSRLIEEGRRGPLALFRAVIDAVAAP